MGLPGGTATPAAFLEITDPSGNHSRIALHPLPFHIGRMAENHLVLRDSRISRNHARILREGEDYIVEDLGSSHGVFVNGTRVRKQALKNADRVEFGFPDSYCLLFLIEDEQGTGAAGILPTLAEPASPAGSNLGRLRATLEVARALQGSLSTDEVLAAVVEAALAITGCERGFLLLRSGDGLATRVARSRHGPLAGSDLRVPAHLLWRALSQRKDFLSMNFDPLGQSGAGPEASVAALELRSAVCIPLVRIRPGMSQQTSMLSPAADTAGLLYLDSRAGAADLSAGNRELLTTLALEASTVLENARLLEEQWAKQRLEQELRIARRIQESLLPRTLPAGGWFRAAGSSVPSAQVGGDYFDVRPVTPGCWSAVLGDVSGKGVGAALLAALLQGMFLASPYTRLSMEEMMARVNRFLLDRTGGEEYVTAFYCTCEREGMLRWVNAGHPPALLARTSGQIEVLPAGGVPAGMLDEAVYTVRETLLRPGDRVILYSDGVTEALNPSGEFFGFGRTREVARAHARDGCEKLHAALASAVAAFTQGAGQNDDATLLVVEFAGPA